MYVCMCAFGGKGVRVGRGERDEGGQKKGGRPGRGLNSYHMSVEGGDMLKEGERVLDE